MSGESTYQPPYTITSEILTRVAQISEAMGRLNVLTDRARELRLRRITRIRTVRGSLAIEGGTLSEAQITAILDGRRVIAPPRAVQEARNALAAYDHFESWRPEVEKDLLDAVTTTTPQVTPPSRGAGSGTSERNEPRGAANHSRPAGPQILP